MSTSEAIPQTTNRNFLPQRIDYSSFTSIEPYFINLLNRKILSIEALESWLKDLSELQSVVSEELRWRMIKMSCDTTNKSLQQSYEQFLQEIDPQVQPFTHKLYKKLLDNPFISTLDPNIYGVFLRRVKNEVALFREENVELISKERILAKKYSAIFGAINVKMNGKDYTFKELRDFLTDSDRGVRKKSFDKMTEVVLEKKQELDNLFDELIQLRHQIATNAGFKNFRDYAFAKLGRLDYTPEDCFEFHSSVESEIMPFVNKLSAEKQEKLNINTFQPYDERAEAEEKPLPPPFNTEEELIKKSVECLHHTDPFFGEALRTLQKINHLDISSRKGKAPGGYNMTLPETGIPFVFMNASNTLRDVKVMLHETGHAVHSILMNDNPVYENKNLPSEIAELAAMSMELITMDNYGVYFEEKEDAEIAVKRQKLKTLEILPWIMTIDSFQHWIYTHPNHSTEERESAWLDAFRRFNPDNIKWDKYPEFEKNRWLLQLHVFQFPFYYIEYGIAQLGAIAVWKNYIQNPKKTINEYKSALSLAYTRTLPELYKTAGISFDFSKTYIRELREFVEGEV